MSFPVYPVGEPGKPWGDSEKKQWVDRQSKQRDFFIEVASRISRNANGDVFQYGELDYRRFGSAQFPMFGIRSTNWDPAKKMAVVTGGVHGYETSGVKGALLFTEQHMPAFESSGINILVLPCVSPWGYEMIQRWNPEAIDPNRCFNPEKPGCGEAALAMKCIEEHRARSAGILMHTDLHETTDTDNSEFRPAKIARDAASEEWSEIPDGFYLVSNTHSPEPAWQKAIIDAVAKVTHIAPPDANGNIIGEPESDHGVVLIEGRKWGICGAHTEARFSTTTEVYPDSKNASPEQCNEAQATVVVTGLTTALSQ